MSATDVTGIVLIALAIAFNVLFALMAARFEYPDILRRPTDEIFTRFREGGVQLLLLWWLFGLTAVALVPTVILVSSQLGGAGWILRVTLTVVGILAALVQFLGIMRWPFLVPYLARTGLDGDPAERAAARVVFQSVNRYLGVAVGEHLGYMFTGLWTLLVGVAALEVSLVAPWLAIAGIVIGVVVALCSLEFVGPFEANGWKLAAQATPIAYVAWSLWLIGMGIALLIE
ncbi:MAG TPA: DUF4386 domain-containing protein [Actinomycetes bacterium]|nr:DUF4386 domain-containing protein [Actinomycetes bacterium]